MKYKPHVNAPSYVDKDYIHRSKGGNNLCIEIANGSCLPNCVGYAWGTWRKMMNAAPQLPCTNAETWYDKVTAYKKGQTPKLGAVACWRGGSTKTGADGCGHVAIVEAIYGKLVTFSQSNYGGARFQLMTLKEPYTLKGQTFQGFIYYPEEWDEESQKEDDRSTYKVQTYKTKVVLKIRTGAGTNYPQKTYTQLTTNAKANAYSTGANKGCLKVGTLVTCLETARVGKQTWMRIPSGWICAWNDGEEYVG